MTIDTYMKDTKCYSGWSVEILCTPKLLCGRLALCGSENLSIMFTAGREWQYCPTLCSDIFAVNQCSHSSGCRGWCHLSELFFGLSSAPCSKEWKFIV